MPPPPSVMSSWPVTLVRAMSSTSTSVDLRSTWTAIDGCASSSSSVSCASLLGERARGRPRGVSKGLAKAHSGVVDALEGFGRSEATLAPVLGERPVLAPPDAVEDGALSLSILLAVQAEIQGLAAQAARVEAVDRSIRSSVRPASFASTK